MAYIFPVRCARVHVSPLNLIYNLVQKRRYEREEMCINLFQKNKENCTVPRKYALSLA